MRTFTIFFLLTNYYLNFGQLVNKSEYDRLVIIDEFNHNFSYIYGRVYKVDLHDSLPQLTLTSEYKAPDTIRHPFYKGRIPNWNKVQNRKPNEVIKEIDPQLVDELILTLNKPKKFGVILFKYLGIDSTWHSHNKNRLTTNWLTTYEQADKIEKEYAKYVLNDFREFQKMVYSLVLQRNTSAYSNATIAFENDHDTLVIQSAGQGYFLLPWESDTTYQNYDPKVSELVSKFLPTDIIINKGTLSPTLEEFEQAVLKQLSFKVNLIDRRKFKKQWRKKSR